jgi:hypothetical protein
LTVASSARYARVEKGGTMKRTQAMVGIAVLASLALLPDVGEADFGGTLMAVEGTPMDITPETLIDSTAVTISYLNLYIELDHSLDGVGSQVRVTQGTTIITRDLFGNGRLVFDVVPVP